MTPSNIDIASDVVSTVTVVMPSDVVSAEGIVPATDVNSVVDTMSDVD